MNVSFVISEIRKRNRVVFKKLFDRFYKELVYYANHYLHDSAQSEDLVQEVFIYIWENADHLDIKTSLKGYMYTMVRNRCLNALKAVGIKDDLEFKDFYIALTEDYNPLINKEEEKSREDFLRAVVKMADTFPPQMQKVFKLWYFNQYEYKMIAEELGIGVSTVKKYLERAKDKIAKSLPLVLNHFL
ncbi:RNA polymerase sigma-70 factor [Sinomicrobium kalidii]|uniref:RNA polymerase sigma factor n=1 Tax=Sinomicrobium kalidii TaxID=2900738 RepID=UPI001E431868|nr:RNA polymerase sigma-70 factor [Sinomicrobium kalidii]UGU15732.1 RNA polymerase sigma-70 factor [Sinomicrobium kalidii]